MSEASGSNGPIFSARGLRKVFGAQVALDDVDIDIHAGRVTGLVGSNGAGKSTLLKILAGALRPDGGELALEGRPLRLDSMRDAAAKGIALVSQELNLFPTLTVGENLQFATASNAARPNAEAAARYLAVLGDLGFSQDLDTIVGALSLADQQLVEIARALLQDPRVLILDEPTSALRKPEKVRLSRVIRQLRDRGVALVYVSHFLEDLLEEVDDLVILRDGRRAEVDIAPTPSALGEVISVMLGQRGAGTREGAGPAAAGARDATATQFKVEPLVITGLEGPGQLRVPSLTFKPGEVIGVAGLAGAGVEALFAVLFGRGRPRAGEVRLPSGRRGSRSIAEAVQSGVAFVPSDRKRTGLMLRDSIAANVAGVRSLALGRDGFFPSPAQTLDRAEARCRALAVKAQSVRQLVGALSGGNQQKVVFAKWLEGEPSLLLLDDPTRGVDIPSKREIHAVIRALAAEGRVVLFSSSEPLEYEELVDRVHVFVGGEIQRELVGEEITEHALVTAMNQRKAG